MGFFTEWKAADDHFPVLERLFISHCIWLEEIPQEFTNIPAVQVIELRDCSVHLTKSAKQIQQEQEDTFRCQVTSVRESNCDYGKIIHISCFDIYIYSLLPPLYLCFWILTA